MSIDAFILLNRKEHLIADVPGNQEAHIFLSGKDWLIVSLGQNYLWAEEKPDEVLKFIKNEFCFVDSSKDVFCFPDVALDNLEEMNLEKSTYKKLLKLFEDGGAGLWLSHKAKKSRKSVSTIHEIVEACGGSLSEKPELQGPNKMLNLANCSIKLEDLKKILTAIGDEVFYLNLTDMKGRIAPSKHEILSEIVKMSRLSQLILDGWQIDDNVCRALMNLSTLTHVSLRFATVPESCEALLTKFKTYR